MYRAHGERRAVKFVREIWLKTDTPNEGNEGWEKDRVVPTCTSRIV